MSAPLREAARLLWELRAQEGWPALAEALQHFPRDEVRRLAATWQIMSHAYQLRPPGATTWMIMGGRGSGKTRGGAEDQLDIAEDWGPSFRGLLCSKTVGDIRDTMINNPRSGLIACGRRRGYEVKYVPGHRTVYHPGGGRWLVLSADSDEAWRGPEFNAVWADEIAKWKNPLYVWHNIELCNRLPAPDGGPPLATITTTPKRGSPIIHYLLNSIEGIQVTRGTTRDNVINLSAEAVRKMESNMAGTTFGRQELEGEFIEVVGAMVSQEVIHTWRVRRLPEDIGRRVVSYDPAVMDKDDSDDHGIVALASDLADPRNAYVLGDRTTEAAVEQAALTVVKTALEFDAHAIVVEWNQGGQWVLTGLRTAMATIGAELGRTVMIPCVPVWAKQAKEVRAEPVGAWYELGRVRHLGVFPALEREATKWIPGMPSPNRLDALVHGVTHLLDGEQGPGPLSAYT